MIDRWADDINYLRREEDRRRKDVAKVIEVLTKSLLRGGLEGEGKIGGRETSVGKDG
jgi:hypothetical protein